MERPHQGHACKAAMRGEAEQRAADQQRAAGADEMRGVEDGEGAPALGRRKAVADQREGRRAQYRFGDAQSHASGEELAEALRKRAQDRHQRPTEDRNDDHAPPVEPIDQRAERQRRQAVDDAERETHHQAHLDVAEPEIGLDRIEQDRRQPAIGEAQYHAHRQQEQQPGLPWLYLAAARRDRAGQLIGDFQLRKRRGIDPRRRRGVGRRTCRGRRLAIDHLCLPTNRRSACSITLPTDCRNQRFLLLLTTKERGGGLSTISAVRVPGSPRSRDHRGGPRSTSRSRRAGSSPRPMLPWRNGSGSRRQ